MGEEKVEVTLPISLLRRVDRVAELIGFSSREEVVVSAIRRFLDRFLALEVEPCSHLGGACSCKCESIDVSCKDAQVKA